MCKKIHKISFLLATILASSLLPQFALQAAATTESSNCLGFYFDIQRALADDSLDKAKASALAMKASVEKELGKKDIPNNFKSVLQDSLNELPKLLTADTILDSRIAFGNISKTWVAHLKSTKSQADRYSLFFCPMFPQGYAFWVQPKSEPLRNPYWGKEMLECGVKRPWQ